MGTNNSLAYTKWECKYHVVFAPKYRRQVICKQIKADVGQILGTLCRRNYIPEYLAVSEIQNHFIIDGFIKAQLLNRH